MTDRFLACRRHGGHCAQPDWKSCSEPFARFHSRGKEGRAGGQCAQPARSAMRPVPLEDRTVKRGNFLFYDSLRRDKSSLQHFASRGCRSASKSSRASARWAQCGQATSSMAARCCTAALLRCCVRPAQRRPTPHGSPRPCLSIIIPGPATPEERAERPAVLSTLKSPAPAFSNSRGDKNRH